MRCPICLSGTYRPGNHQVRVQQVRANGIVLQVGVNPTIDISLDRRHGDARSYVQAEAVMVDTKATESADVTRPRKCKICRSMDGQLTDLLYLSGAVSEGRAFRASYPSSAVLSIAGGAQGSVAYWLDGGTHNDPLSNQNLPLPFPDTIEEFKVETSSLPAQYGTHPSGAVNVITKSGIEPISRRCFRIPAK